MNNNNYPSVLYRLGFPKKELDSGDTITVTVEEGQDDLGYFGGIEARRQQVRGYIEKKCERIYEYSCYSDEQTVKIKDEDVYFLSVPNKKKKKITIIFGKYRILQNSIQHCRMILTEKVLANEV